MKQEQPSVKRISLIVGDALLVKEGMAGKVQITWADLSFEQMRSTVSFPFEPREHQ
jgi:hypothetical protein